MPAIAKQIRHFALLSEACDFLNVWSRVWSLFKLAVQVNRRQGYTMKQMIRNEKLHDVGLSEHYCSCLRTRLFIYLQMFIK